MSETCLDNYLLYTFTFRCTGVRNLARYLSSTHFHIQVYWCQKLAWTIIFYTLLHSGLLFSENRIDNYLYILLHSGLLHVVRNLPRQKSTTHCLTSATSVLRQWGLEGSLWRSLFGPLCELTNCWPASQNLDTKQYRASGILSLLVYLSSASYKILYIGLTITLFYVYLSPTFAEWWVVRGERWVVSSEPWAERGEWWVVSSEQWAMRGEW